MRFFHYLCNDFKSIMTGFIITHTKELLLRQLKDSIGDTDDTCV